MFCGETWRKETTWESRYTSDDNDDDNNNRNTCVKKKKIGVEVGIEGAGTLER
jgi:hypothetical protein